MTIPTNQYSGLEKTLHSLAFKSWSLQTSLSGLESQIYRKELSTIEIRKPVFVTALPRAGTTLLLELCVETNEFASHTYRDMPFILIPLFWNSFSRLFRSSGTYQERAHGDGMMISIDSPEAFEEIIWKGFWPSRYQEDRIVPWTNPPYPDFEEFFYDHIKKILFLRSSAESSRSRYISKNNANISRIEYLKKAFPDSIIIVPFRNPLQHASSLMRQHNNFLKIHDEDSFALRYMKDIGHFDFGKNLRPIDFDEWFSSRQAGNPETLVFWLQYWISSYNYLLENAGHNVSFFSFDTFCNSPGKSLEKLGTVLEMNNFDKLMESAGTVSPPKEHSVDTGKIPSDVLNKAEALYKDLENSSL